MYLHKIYEDCEIFSDNVKKRKEGIIIQEASKKLDLYVAWEKILKLLKIKHLGRVVNDINFG